jgi:tetraacyldisaccharide 4'-kinase
VLRGLSALFGRVARLRRQAYLAGRKPGERAGLPVIVVGNLAVGGAGKTPLTIALVEALRARGFAPGVISRGYGRDDVSIVRRVSTDDDARFVGDEPLLIARRTKAPVAVAARRIDAARLLAATNEVNVLIADDGLQHYALARDVEILVVDGRRRFGNGRLLPAGPLREPLERADACDFVVVNGGQAQDEEVQMRLELSRAVALHDGHAKPLAEFRGSNVHALAGIADPERFFSSLRGHGLDITTHAFADHHDFSVSDLDFGDAAPVLMTEKDAVKCAAFAQPNWYAVPVQAKLPESFFDAVAQRIRARREAYA